MVEETAVTTNPIPMDEARRRNPAGRVPPHNLQAEESLLGAMLITARAIDDTAHLHPEHMYQPAHGHILQAIQTLHTRGEPADTVTVADQLRRDGLLDSIGGPRTLITLQANTPATSAAPRWAQIVVDMATLRRLIAVAGEIAELGYSTPTDIAGTVDRCEAMLLEAAGDQRHTGVQAQPFRDALTDWLGHLENLYERGEHQGIRTGLIDLDQLLLGFRPGQLITICARPSMGKSQMGNQIAVRSAQAGHHTLLVNVEMSNNETVDRVMAAESQVDLTRIRSGQLVEQDWPRISRTIGTHGELDLTMLDDPSATIASIRAHARRLHNHKPVELIVVDYLQLITAATGGRRDKNRQEDVAEISNGLKRIAREMRIPVIALAQLNRQLEYRADKRPMLADLRESGAIEQDSDIVIGLYRDEVYHPDTPDRNIVEIIVMKQRNGPAGVVKVAWQRMRFDNLARI